MKKLLYILLAAILTMMAAASVWAKDYEVKRKAGDYQVTLKLDKSSPVVGENNIEITVADAKNAAVTNADVTVEYTMPAMAGMPAMNYKTKAQLKGNKYLAKMNLSMAGSWNVAVKITRGGKTVTAKFGVDAS